MPGEHYRSSFGEVKKALLLSISMMLSLSSICAGQDHQILKVGLFSNGRPSAALMAPHSGDYDVLADGKVVANLKSSMAFQMTVVGDKISCKTLSKPLGIFSKIELRSKVWGSSFKVKGTRPTSAQRIYDDQLIVTVVSGKLKMINVVEIEHYIGGVIESESGKGKLLEYYKVQAVISRTYALKQFHRHEKEGFNLCDDVHCQAYKSRSTYDPNTLKGAYQTKGYVLVDPEINLITAAFHSNCGGQTIASGDVWNYDLPYLQPVCDTFCTAMPHAIWERNIPKASWTNYLTRKYQFAALRDSVRNTAYNNVPGARNEFLFESEKVASLKHIRTDWKLRSTSFSTTLKGDHVHLQGNGFGHGVGLCQEGAMRMAESGWKYDKILTYYYYNIHLIDLKQLAFFKQE